MINYLIEVSICLVAFYVCYRISLSRLKLLNLNRAYLLATLLLSLAIPLLDISLYQTDLSIAPEISDYITGSASVSADTGVTNRRASPVLLTWLVGAGVTAILFMTRMIRLIGLIRKYPKQKTGRLWYVSVPDEQPTSSFFQYVFVPASVDMKSEETQAILKHEEKHTRDWHSLDLILTELSGILLWFNPVIYLYRKSLKIQHEYIADEAVVHSYDKNSYSDLLVRYSLKQSGFSLTHSFSEHPVERRLKMIDNINPTTMKKLRLLWSLPLIFILMLTFGFDQQASSQTVSGGSTPRTGPKLKGHVIDGASGKALEKVAVFIIHSRENTIVKAGGKTYHRRSGLFTDTQGDYLLLMDKTDSLVVFRKKDYEDIIVPYTGQDVVNVALTKKAVPDKQGNN
ncbi:MAG: hypothetical protein Roseis2KO_58460 [Roseivirga sp.]